MRAIRRLYFYLMAFASLNVVAVGAANLVRVTIQLWGGGGRYDILSSAWRQEVSLFAAMILVALPTYLFHWAYIRRLLVISDATDGTERPSLLRHLYWRGMAAVGALVLLFQGQRFLEHLLRAIMGGESRPLIALLDQGVGPLAFVVIYGVLWAWHLGRIEGEAADEAAAAVLQRLYFYGVSLLSLGFLAGGTAALWGTIVRMWLEPSNGGEVRPERWWLTPLAAQSAALLAGLALWAWHWGRRQRRALRAEPQDDAVVGLQEKRSVLRRAFLYLVILLCVVVVVVVATSLLQEVLRWLLGLRLEGERPLGAIVVEALGSLAILGVFWGYHHWVIVRDAPAGEGSGQAQVRRLYYALLSGVGLVAVLFSTASLLRVLLAFWAALPGPWDLGQRVWAEPASSYAALLLVGLPLWALHWGDLQHHARSDAAERRALPRRIYLYLAALVPALIVLFQGAALARRLFLLLLGEPWSADLVAPTVSSFSFCVVALLFWGYHWNTLRRDGALGREEEAGERGSGVAIALVGELPAAFPEGLAADLQRAFPRAELLSVMEATPEGLQVLQRASLILLPLSALGASPESALGALALAARRASAPKLLLADDLEGYEVVGVERRQKRLVEQVIARVAHHLRASVTPSP